MTQVRRRLGQRLAGVALTLSVVAGFLVAVAAPAHAAITTPFAKMFSVNTSGDIQIRGNTVMTCQIAATKCAAARTSTNTTGADNNNNNFFMSYIDVDNDPTTFDSSSASVAIPTGASVLFAALTWGGNIGAGTAITDTATYGTGTPTAAPASNGTQVKLKVPGTSTYQTLTSTRSTPSGATGTYQGYYDATSIVAAAGNGSYTVGNVQSGTGGNQYAGWSLTIAYSNPTDPPRNLTVFAGYGSVAATNVVDIGVSGFQTPLTGAVKTTLGAISYEGDYGSTGDQLQLGNTTSDLQNVSDALHQVANTFDSVISDNGVDGSDRTPKYKNQLGYDQATFVIPPASHYLTNNATSADIRLTSNTGGETYYPGVITFSTELYAPQLTATKSVAVVAKASGNVQSGVPEPGDTLRYTISASNTGADNAINTLFSDAIPTGTTYVPGSLTAAGTTLTDATGDDVGSYGTGPPTVRVNIGTGAGTAVGAGGTVAVGAATATVTFDVTVNSNITDGSIISNAAQFTYTGYQNGLASAVASNAVTAAAVRHHSALSVTKTANRSLVQKGAGTQVTYTLTASNAGPYDDPGVTITDTLPAGATVVSATPSAGTCTRPTGQVVCAVGAMANAGTASVVIVVTLDSTTDPATDTATVAGQNVDDNPSDNTATASTAVNTAPVAVDDSATTSGGTATINVRANDSDANNDPLTVTPGSTTATKGSAVVNADQTITYTANAGAIGADSFSYVLSDGRGGSATATVRITIPNAPPQAQADATTTTPRTPVTVAVLGNDTDPNIPGSGQTLSVSAVTQPAGSKGTVTTNGTTVTFTPSITFGQGAATFTYTVSDGVGGTDTATVTVTIPNTAPVAADDTAATAYLTPVTVDVLANDSDDNGDPLTITAVSGATHGTATITGTGTATKIRYTPAAGWSGADTMTYTITDGTTTTTGHLTVTTANGVPTAAGYAVTVSGATPTTLNPVGHASDPNGDTVTVVGAAGASHGTVSVDGTGHVVYTPNGTYAGADSFTYTVSDGNGGTATATVTVTVANQAPDAHDDTALVPLNRSAVITVLANDTDPNADLLSVTGTGTPAHGTAVAHVNGTITYTPTIGYLGDDSFTYDISDGRGGTDTATVTVTVANQAPVAVDDTAVAAGAAGSPVTIDVLANDSDPNDDPVSISAVSVPAHGTAAIAAGEIIYTPLASYTGTDVFTYTVSDGRGGLSVATVTVNVENRNPVANPDSAAAATGQARTIDVVANDTDPDGEAVSLLSVDATSAHGGSVHLGVGGVIYTSAAGFAGTDTFDYVITDPRGGTATGVVTVTVTATTVTLTSSSPAVHIGDTVVLTAAVGPGSPSGSVTFTDAPPTGSAVSLGSAPVSGGTAAVTVPMPAFGANVITALYGGDGTHAPTTSAAVSVEVSAYSGELIVSEFRSSGPSGADDSYVELLNTGSAAPLAGFRIETSSGTTTTLPASAPTLPAGRSYLVTGGIFSLVASIATADLTVADLGTGGIRIVAPDTAGTLTDAVGPSTGFHSGTPLSVLTGTPSAQWAWVRLEVGGAVQDSGDNAADFALVAKLGEGVGGQQSMRGSASPTGLTDLFQHNSTLVSTLLDPAVSAAADPNRVVTAGPPRTLVIRRTITNRTGATITAAKIRVTALSEANGAPRPGGSQPAQVADLRAVNPQTATTAVTVSGGATVTVHNLSVDAPITDPSGGGLNSTLAVPLPVGGLADGASISFAVTFDVDTHGTFWFAYDVDADAGIQPANQIAAHRTATRAATARAATARAGSDPAQASGRI